MRTIHWWLISGHWFSAIAEVGETAEQCLNRARKNLTVIICSLPSGYAPFEWEYQLRHAVHKPNLSRTVK